jgi:hypothetical protein
VDESPRYIEVCGPYEKDGVVTAMTAREQEGWCLLLYARLPTAEEFDAIAREADVLVDPTPRDPELAAFTALDDDIRHARRFPEQTVCAGKTWIAHPRIREKGAVNYGWKVPIGEVRHVGGEAKWRGIKVHKNVSGDGYVIQPPGAAHGPDHVDYCLAPDTRVLTSDLRWVPVAGLGLGDELIGFDESLGHNCRLRRSAVLSVSQTIAECFEIATSAATVVASAEHRWPTTRRRTPTGKQISRSNLRWTHTASLRVGDMIPYLCQPWEQDTSWDGAWMAGFLDGEGWCSGRTFGVGQNPGALLDRALQLFARAGMPTSAQANKYGCMRVCPTGARAGMRAIGTFRPIRLLAKSATLWEGSRCYSSKSPPAEILSIRPLGPRPVIGVGTSTGTLIAEGLLSHNSQLGYAVRDVDGGFEKYPPSTPVTSPATPEAMSSTPVIPPPPMVPREHDTDRMPVVIPELAELVADTILAKNYTAAKRPLESIRLIVLHSTENPVRTGVARNVARWFGGPSAPRASAHFVVGPEEVIACVPLEHAAWAAPGANHDGVQVEQVGQALRTDWLKNGKGDTAGRAVLTRSAMLVATLCRELSIPPVRVDHEQLLAGARGITSHAAVSLAYKKSSHVDPGGATDSRWPWDEYLDLVLAAM